MKRIILFNTLDKTVIIQEMMRHNSANIVGLNRYGKPGLNKGDLVEMPETNVGKVIYVRRRVFIFWKWEYLIEKESDWGLFYRWYKASKVAQA